MNLKELLDITVKPYVSTALIQPAALERINNIAYHLPEQLTSFFGFECRLGNPNPLADFLLCIFREGYGQSILANAATHKSQLPQAWLRHPVWKNIRLFAQNWHEKMDNLWLEFDIAEEQNESIPIPSFFFAPYDTTQKRFLRSQESYDIIIAGLKTIKAGQIDVAVQQQLQTVIHALPAEAYIFQVGTMLARPIQTYRICIRNINALALPAFLEKVGWQGNSIALYTLLEQLYTMVDRVDLDIDVHSSVGPKIGLECYLEMDNKREERWQSFLTYLVDNNLCTRQKKEALANFTGVVHQGMTKPHRYPAHLQQMTSFIGNKYTSLYFRDIHHIKLSFEGADCLEAKAYLRVKHIWASNAQLKAQIRKQRQSIKAK